MTIKPTGIQSTIEFESIKSEEEDYNSSPLDYRLVNYPTDFTLENLHQQWKSQELIIPPIQNQSQWSKLIESFLLRLPVPEVFVYKERKGTEYILLDGHQRFKSIFSFMDGVFVNETSTFRLVGLNPESPFSQKSYSDLTETDQRKFNNSLLRAYIIQQLIPDDSSSIFHIFQRLNNGANFLTNQEIRNSICHGNFVQFLAKLNHFLDWRKILGRDDLDKYFHDVELNVRFLAISNLSPCKKPMNEHLSQFMTSIKTFLIRHVCNATNFEKTCTDIVHSLGEKPFHIRNGMNSAVYDSIMFAFPNHFDHHRSDLKSRFVHLMDDDNYKVCIHSSTTDETVIGMRMRIASEMLFPQ